MSGCGRAIGFRRQRGESVWMILFLMLAIGSMTVSLDDSRPASFEDVRDLVSDADRHEQARALVAEGLKASPRPTRAELRELRDRAEAILTAQLVEKATGVQAVALERTKEEAESAKVNAALHRPLFEHRCILVALNVVIAAGVAACVWRAVVRG